MSLTRIIMSAMAQVAQDFLSLYERWLPTVFLAPLRRLRERALKFVIDYIHAEDLQTNYVDIGPVNKALNMLSAKLIGTGGDKSCIFVY